MDHCDKEVAIGVGVLVLNATGGLHACAKSSHFYGSFTATLGTDLVGSTSVLTFWSRVACSVQARVIPPKLQAKRAGRDHRF
jgi:hypothetical protein